MEFTEMEKRLLYQTEGCERYAIINELSMASQYAGDPARRKAAKDLMEKLRPLSDAECMNLVRDIQKNYRLPKEGRTIGELIAEARQKSGAEKLKGHDIMALERFDPEDRERQNFLHFFYFFISHEQRHSLNPPQSFISCPDFRYAFPNLTMLPLFPASRDI